MVLSGSEVGQSLSMESSAEGSALAGLVPILGWALLAVSFAVGAWAGKKETGRPPLAGGLLLAVVLGGLLATRSQMDERVAQALHESANSSKPGPE